MFGGGAPAGPLCDDGNENCHTSTSSSTSCSVHVGPDTDGKPVRRCVETRRVMRHCLGRAPEEIESHSRTTEEELRLGEFSLGSSLFGGRWLGGDADASREGSDDLPELARAQREAERQMEMGAEELMGHLLGGFMRTFGDELADSVEDQARRAAGRDGESAQRGPLSHMLGRLLGGSRGDGDHAPRQPPARSPAKSPHVDLPPGGIKEI